MDMDLSAPVDLQAPFLGFIAGAVLLGVTILQAWQYFVQYTDDSKTRKLIICIVCILDSLHFAFSATMMYSSFTSPLKYSDPNVVWSLKAMATVKTILMILVQGFYLQLIWVLAGSLLMRMELVRTLKSFSVFAFAYAIAIAIAFLTFLEKISNISNFPLNFERMIYVGFGSTAAIDCGIAIIMSTVLFKNSSGASTKGNGVVTYLVVFFVGTGVLTALAALATVGLYTANRSSVLYLGIEFSVSRLYANSILTLFNAKASFKKRLEGSKDIYIPSALVFGEDAAQISLPQSPTIDIGKEMIESP